jgi:hypothetical protein
LGDSTARVIIYDLETAPNLSYIWGHWEQNAIAHVREWHLLSIAWKFLGDRKVQAASLPDFSLYATDPHNDQALVEFLHGLLDECDIAITHNGKAFDDKKANARFIYHNLQPPSPYKQIDTLQVARHGFAFNSNSLNDLCEHLNIGTKKPHNGFKTWLGCMNNDEKSWKTMVEYNIYDVVLLDKLYHRLLPWIPHHPNLTTMNDDRPEACPRCGKGPMQKRGWLYAGVTKRQRFQCTACGGYCAGRQIVRSDSQYQTI